MRHVLDRRRDKGHPQLPLLSVRLDEGVVLRNMEDRYVAPSIELTGYQRVAPGDIVMNQLGKPHGAIGMSRHEGIISPAYFVLRTANGVHPKFMHYLLRSWLYLEELRRRSKWMPPSQLDISWDQFRDIDVLVPAPDEQRLIADFLDRETHRIDALVDAKRRMIERLVEKRDALITLQTWSEAGLMTKLGFHVDLVAGYAFPSDSFSSSPEDIALLRGTNVGVGWTRWDDAVYWPRGLLDGLQRYQLDVGDIVLGLDRPWITGGIRVASIEASDLPALVLQRVLRIRARQTVVQPFIFYLLQSRRFLAHFEPDMTGISVPHISPDQVAAFAFPLPPRSEQEEVVAELNRRTSGISSAIETLTKQLHLLAEYRQALITQAVTGQLDESTLTGDKPVNEAVGVIPE